MLVPRLTLFTSLTSNRPPRPVLSQNKREDRRFNTPPLTGQQ
jgi:hypothetical protein